MARLAFMSVGALIGSVFLLSGCDIESVKAAQTARMLDAASFSRITPETPRQQEDLQRLPQRLLFRFEEEGEIYFAFADAQYCECLYVGDEDAIRNYERMVRQATLATWRQLRADFSGMSLRVWGPWDWY